MRAAAPSSWRPSGKQTSDRSGRKAPVKNRTQKRHAAGSGSCRRAVFLIEIPDPASAPDRRRSGIMRKWWGCACACYLKRLLYSDGEIPISCLNFRRKPEGIGIWRYRLFLTERLNLRIARDRHPGGIALCLFCAIGRFWTGVKRLFRHAASHAQENNGDGCYTSISSVSEKGWTQFSGGV